MSQVVGPAADVEQQEESGFACLWCHRVFEPAKHNQLYCGPKCRGRALRMRRRVEEHQAERGIKRLSARRLLAVVNACRLRSGRPLLIADAQLEAMALAAEAHAQAARWNKLFTEREARSKRLGEPTFCWGKQKLLPGEEVQIPESATRAEIVSTDGAVAIVYYDVPVDDGGKKSS